jgi:hypothetical protein
MIEPANHDQDLRDAFRERRTGAARPGACPSPERIEAAVDGRCESDELNEILDHTAACPACAAAWRLARSLQGQDRKVVRTSRFRKFTSPRWTALAAAAVLVLAVGVAVVPDLIRQQRGPVFRSNETTAVRSSMEDGTALPRDRFVLRWAAELDDAVYSVQVLDRDLNVLVSADHLTETEYEVPEVALESLGPGDVVLWRVEALPPDGRPVGSPTFTVTIE